MDGPTKERIDALRAEIAVKHGLLLDPTDPIFVAVTLNEAVLGQCLDAAGLAAERAERASAARMIAQSDRVKADAERMIGGAAEVIAETMRSATDELQRQLRATLDNARPVAAPSDSRLPTVLAVALGVAAGTAGTALIGLAIALW